VVQACPFPPRPPQSSGRARSRRSLADCEISPLSAPQVHLADNRSRRVHFFEVAHGEASPEFKYFEFLAGWHLSANS